MSVSRVIPALPYLLVVTFSALWVVLFVPGSGFTQDALLELTRLTARTSVFFFITAFAASALFKLTASNAGRLLVRNRRHIGLAFALAHFIHLGVLIAYFVVSGVQPDAVVIFGGGAAYGLIAIMALTSNRRAQRKLGRSWRKIHLVSSWYVWLIFLNSYVGRLAEQREPVWLFGGITALLLLAALLRVAARVRHKRSERAERNDLVQQAQH